MESIGIKLGSIVTTNAQIDRTSVAACLGHRTGDGPCFCGGSPVCRIPGQQHAAAGFYRHTVCAGKTLWQRGGRARFSAERLSVCTLAVRSSGAVACPGCDRAPKSVVDGDGHRGTFVFVPAVQFAQTLLRSASNRRSGAQNSTFSSRRCSNPGQTRANSRVASRFGQPATFAVGFWMVACAGSALR